MSKMKVFRAENGSTFQIDVNRNTTVEQVMETISRISGIPTETQYLLMNSTRMEKARTLGSYDLPSDNMDKLVLVFDKRTTNVGYLIPETREPLFELKIIPVPALNPAEELQVSPLVWAIKKYEHRFLTQLNTAKALKEVMEKQMDFIRSVVFEEEIVRKAIYFIQENAKDYFLTLWNSYSTWWTNHASPTLEKSSDNLLKAFEVHLSKLGSTKLHESLTNSSGGKTLRDFIPEAKLRKYFETMNQEFGQLKVALSEYSREISSHREKYELNPRKNSFSVVESSSILRNFPKKLKEISEEIQLRTSLFEEDLPEIGKVLKSGVKSGLGWELADKLEEKNKFRTHQLNLLSERFKSLRDIIREVTTSKNRAQSEFQGKMMEIAETTGMTRNLSNRLVVLNDALQRWKEPLSQLAYLQNMPTGYNAAMMEVARRRSWGKSITTIIQKMNENIAKIREEEIQKRNSFLKEMGRYIPKDIIPGLQDPIPALHLQIPHLDPSLPPAIDPPSPQLDESFHALANFFATVSTQLGDGNSRIGFSNFPPNSPPLPSSSNPLTVSPTVIDSNFDLKKRVENLEKSLSEAYTKLENSEKVSADYKEKLEKVQKEKSDISGWRDRLEYSEKVSADFKEKLEKVQRELRETTEKSEKVRQEMEKKWEISEKEMALKLEVLEISRKELEEKLEISRTQVEESREKLEKFQRSEKQWEEKLQKSEISQNDRSKQFQLQFEEEKLRITAENSQKIESLQKEIQRFDEMNKKISQEKDRFAVETSQKIESLQKEIQRIEEMKKKIFQEKEVAAIETSKKIRTLEEEISEGKKNLLKLEENYKKILQEKENSSTETSKKIQLESFNQIQKLEKEISSAKKILEEKEKQVAELSKKIQDLERENSLLKKILEEKEIQSKEISKRFSELEKEFSEVKKGRENFEKNWKEISEKNEKLKSQLEISQKNSEELSKENEKLQEHSRKMEEISRKYLQLVKTEKEISDEKDRLVKENVTLKRNLEEISTKMKQTEEENKKILGIFNQFNDKISKLEEEKKNLLKEMESAKKGEFAEKLKELEKKVQEKEDRYNQLSPKYVQAVKQLAEKNRGNDELNKKLQEKEIFIEELLAKLELFMGYSIGGEKERDAKLLDKISKRLTEISRDLEDRDVKNLAISSEISERETIISQLKGEIGKKETTISRLSSECRELEVNLVDLKKKLKDSENTIQELHSWRLAASLAMEEGKLSVGIRKKIAWKEFEVGDLVLFLLNEKGFYEAFGRPDYYLSQSSSDSFRKESESKSPIVGQVVMIMDKRATADDNPFKLNRGKEYHEVLVSREN